MGEGVGLVIGVFIGVGIAVLFYFAAAERDRTACMKQYDRATCHQVWVPGPAEETL